MRKFIAFTAAAMLIATPALAQDICAYVALDAAQMVQIRNMGRELKPSVLESACGQNSHIPDPWPAVVCNSTLYSVGLVFDNPMIQEHEARGMAYDHCNKLRMQAYAPMMKKLRDEQSAHVIAKP